MISDNSFGYHSIIYPQKCACVDVMFENSANFDYLENYGNTQETDERKPSLSISKHSENPDNYGTYEPLEFITNNTASNVSNVNAIVSLYKCKVLTHAQYILKTHLTKRISKG